MRQHDQRIAPGMRVVAAVEDAAERGSDAKHLEVVARNEQGSDAGGIMVIGGVRGDAVSAGQPGKG